MKLSKSQKIQLFGQNIGTGFIAFKTAENELLEFEFYVGKDKRIRKISDTLKIPAINLNEEVVLGCQFKDLERII